MLSKFNRFLNINVLDLVLGVIYDNLSKVIFEKGF